MLSIKNLRFFYDDTVLFNNISLSVAAGSITALIGANGAGKSTLMNCITGVLHPSSGDIRVDGLSLADNVNNVRRRIGYLPDNFGLFSALTARQHLEYAATAHGIADAAALDTVIAQTDLQALLGKTPDTMSRGQRQRLGIAMILVHKPRFILLDEPASGLDPSARLALSNLLIALRDSGATLLVSSHILSELRDYASDYIIMHQGGIVASGSLSEADKWRITLTDGAALAQLQTQLAAMPEISDISERDGAVYYELATAADSAAILRQLVNAEIPISEYARAGSDIEKIYQECSLNSSQQQ